MGKIFISYRRDDTAGYTGRIYDRLVQKYGKNSLFMDVDTIPPGVNFKRYIDGYVASTSIMLVMIGKLWANISDSHGNRRLNNPQDFVRIEIASALERGIPVIPVLVRGAQMPNPNELPSDLKDLIWQNAIAVDDRNFHHDMDDLIEGIDLLLESTESEIYQPTTVKAPKPVRQSAPAPKPIQPSRPQQQQRPAPVVTQPPPQPRVNPRLNQIASMFDFTLEELQLNRNKQLSARQKNRTRVDWGSVIGSIVFILIVGSVLFASTSTGDPSVQSETAGTQSFLYCGVYIFVAIAIGTVFTNLSKLGTPKVQKISGFIHVHNNRRAVTVKGRKSAWFSVSKGDFKLHNKLTTKEFA